MNLSTYIEDRERLDALAAACHTSSAYLKQIASGHRSASPALARVIEIESGGEVAREDLRPDIFGHLDKAA